MVQSLLLMTLQDLRKETKTKADLQKAKILARFFKTGKGEYGEGDVFLGITVPDSRKFAIKYKDLPLSDVKALLQSKIHEERLIALLILVYKFNSGLEEERKRIYTFYIKLALSQKSATVKIGDTFEAKNYAGYINNWDLVDLSADKIVGAYLLDKPRNMLYQLARSENIWAKRIAIIATYQFIKEKKEYKGTFAIAQLLLDDKHDLIQKAVGWMLREVGKHVSREVEESFLRKHYRQMPRTALRYAIEHFPKPLQQAYLKGLIKYD